MQSAAEARLGTVGCGLAPRQERKGEDTMRRYARPIYAVLGGTFTLAATLSAAAEPARAAQPGTGSGRYLVTVRDTGDYTAVRASLTRSGARIVTDLPEIGAIVIVTGTGSNGNALAGATATPGVEDA